MILALKSHLTVDKLKQHSFYKDFMLYSGHISEILWHYFYIEDKLFTEAIVKEIVNDRDIMEYSVDLYGLEPKISTEYIPTNANFKLQWAFKNIGQYNGFPNVDARITKAWSKYTGSWDIIVAVIDSGIDVDHECLLGHIYFDPKESVNLGVDSDGNGYKNDFIGWNMEKKTFETFTKSHGTAVASCITTNGNGMSGVTMRSKIMPVAIGDIGSTDVPRTNFGSGCGAKSLPWEDATAGPYASIPTSRVAEGIVYAANKGAHIINVSYANRNTAKIGCCGTYPYSSPMPDVRDAIKFAGTMGCIVVTAAGDISVEQQSHWQSASHGTGYYSEACSDDGPPSVVRPELNCYPGAFTRYFSHQINVTAHDNWGYLYTDYQMTSLSAGGFGGWFRGCCYSGSTVDIAAPGKDILVAMPDNQYATAGGTSLAAAFVSGTASLIWGKNPYLKNREVVDIIKATSNKNQYWSGKVVSSGMLDVNAAISANY